MTYRSRARVLILLNRPPISGARTNLTQPPTDLGLGHFEGNEVEPLASQPAIIAPVLAHERDLNPPGGRGDGRGDGGKAGEARGFVGAGFMDGGWRGGGRRKEPK